MIRKLRVAVVGLGVGKGHLESYAKVSDHFEVKAVCDLDAAKAKAAAEPSLYHPCHVCRHCGVSSRAMEVSGRGPRLSSAPSQFATAPMCRPCGISCSTRPPPATPLSEKGHAQN